MISPPTPSRYAPTYRSLLSVCRVATIGAFLSCALAPADLVAHGFEVIKNVNSGKPPEDKLLIFEKGKPHDHLVFIDDENCKFGFTDDGALECLITGNAEVVPRIAWKGGGIPETFDLLAHDYVIATLRVEGNQQMERGGKMVDQRADNMWVPIALFDAKGEVLGSANLADPTPDIKTPATTTTLKFPKSLLTFWGPGKGQVSAIGFKWNGASADVKRNYRIVIDKIALANDP